MRRNGGQPRNLRALSIYSWTEGILEGIGVCRKIPVTYWLLTSGPAFKYPLYVYR
jgi:hypothetical protein